ncbi:MAG: hypothetical protein WA771_00160 [Chthoniobacterales bacterium]
MSQAISEAFNDSKAATAPDISPFQQECIQLFVHAAKVANLPRSVGQIYGFLYASRRPKHLDEVVEGLGISKGSASQGLRLLRNLGAVKMNYVEGDRRERFLAETELRRLATGFLRNTVDPHVRNGYEYLARIERAAQKLEDKPDRDFAEARLEKLQRWHRFVHRILPLVVRMAQKF